MNNYSKIMNDYYKGSNIDYNHVIDNFDGQYEFLSNFYKSPFVFTGIKFFSVEHAFQCYKTIKNEDFNYVYESRNSYEAKKRGKSIKLREDWESVKILIMEKLVFSKFNQNYEIYDKLIKTYPKILIEGNTWGDRFWGICNHSGENMLGRILMKIRDELSLLYY